MKTIIIFILTFVSTAFSSIPDGFLDPETDRQILECIHSPQFCNSTIDYQFAGHTYEIRIIRNPHQQMLWGKDLSSPVSWTLVMTGNMPLELVSHIRDLVPDLLDDSDDYYIQLRGLSELSEDALNSLQPVAIAEQIDDPLFDEQIKKIFSSTDFVNEVFCYHVDDEYYQVRIIHNPERRLFSPTRKFRIYPGAPLRSYIIYWNDRYGIVTDKHAPQKLIDHLSQLTHASWWDWYINFTVRNGTFVEYHDTRYRYTSSDIVTIYYLDSWFNFMEEFQ